MKKFKIYTLTSSDKPEEVRYVGITQSDSIKTRFSGHKYCAMHPEKRSLPVHKWMYKEYLSGNNIIIKEIDSCNEDEWEEKEKYWISHYKEGGKLLNISKGRVGIVTKEMRSKDGIQRSIEGHYKQITLLDKKGNIIEHCPSIKYACEKYNISGTSIGNVLSGRSKSAGGFYIVETDKFKSANFNLNLFIQSLNNSYKQKNIYRFNLDGSLKEVLSSRNQFHKKYGFDKDAISRAIKNKTIYKNSYWSENNSIDTNEFIPEFKYTWNNKNYRTLKELAKELNIAECTVTNAKNNNRPLRGFYVELYKR